MMRPFLTSSSSTLKRRTPALLLGLALSTALAACCGKKQDAAKAAAAAAARKAPEVGVVTVQLGTVTLGTELPGRLEASRVAEVRARAAGIVLKRHFQEGSTVKAGQTLFTIDAGPYRAAYSSAQANHAQASALVKRYQPLLAANAVSKQEYDAAVAAAAAARAQLETARINLGYTRVTAPIAGRIGRELVSEGALVGQGVATHLATIQQVDPMYINLSQSANEVLQLRQALQAGQLASAGGGESARVEVLFENGQTYAHAGRLLFTDLSVDPATGQVQLRAEVPNPDRLLLPGMYVRVRVQQAEVHNAVLLPQQAVTRGSKGDIVMVVGPDNSFAPRPVKIGQAQGSNWVVLGGLQPGERVIVDGFMRLRPGVKQVRPVLAGEKTGVKAGAGMGAGAGGAAVASAAGPGQQPAPAASGAVMQAASSSASAAASAAQ
ncbi:MAG: efflux RND transporter periplasmic adaptor subunit [Brachymonas sp.]|nr:efflux RND transporter periplasmic adaptor subunit [Brachymonas sp.]